MNRSLNFLLIVYPSGCYPYIEQDPFILLRSPHLYVIGNQPEFETDMIEGVEPSQFKYISSLNLPI